MEEHNNHIFELPPELILNIFRYVDSRTLYSKVILSCKYFHEILTGEGVWKALFALKWEGHKFVQDLSYICSWSKVYLTFEDIDTFWRNKTDNRLKKKKIYGHIGSIDALHIMPSKQIIVSGSRDRTALVWKVGDFIEDNLEGCAPTIHQTLKHNGWVWAVGSDPSRDDQVVTTAWDTKVKLWNIEDGSCINTYEYHPAPILAVRCEINTVTTGCYDKRVRQLDTRSGEVTKTIYNHKKPVLSLQMTDKYIFSGSEDRTVAIYDRYADKTLTKLRLDSSALCMDLGFDQGLSYLKVAGKDGNLFIFDISDGSRFSLLNTFDLWSEPKKVTGIANYRGCMVACSEGGSIRAYTPDRSCSYVRLFDDVHGGMGVTSCCASGNLMLTGGEDCSVCIWKYLDDV